MSTQFRKTVDIKTVDEEARTATGAVLVPGELDHQGDFLRPEGVRRFHADDAETGVMHAAFPDDAAEFTRSEVIDEPEVIGEEEFPAGTWIATRKYHDDQLWQFVEEGVLTGFSIGGRIEEFVDHDTLPDDVAVPEAVDADVAAGPVTELVDGQINEVSDVDIPAVPRATYKGEDLGKSILEDVESEEEFVVVMVEERGHDEGDARDLYRYLTDVRAGQKADGDGQVGKPFTSPEGAEFEDFDDCVDTIAGDGTSREEAKRICGAWQAETKVEVDGTEIDLTPPVAMVNAVRAAAAAGRGGLIPSDCGTGTGDQRRQQILDGELSPGVVREIASYLVSHEGDVTAEGPPSEWSEEEWADCGNAQYAKWGGTGGGEPREWAMRRVNEIDQARGQELTYPELENVNDTTKFDYESGDWVSWDASGGRAQGRVVERTEDGQFDQAISGDITVEGSEDDPAYLIEVWQGRGDDASAIDEESGRGDTMHVAHRESELREVSDPRETEASKGGVLAWLKDRFGAGGGSGTDDGTAPEAPDATAKTGRTLSERNIENAKAVIDAAADMLEQADGERPPMRFTDRPDDGFDIAEFGRHDTERSKAAAGGEAAEATSKHATGGEMPDSTTSMSDDTDTEENDPMAEAPEWAKALHDDVQKNSERIDEALDKAAAAEEGGETDGEESDPMAEAPEWAKALHDDVRENSERIEEIGKQSGAGSQQLGKTTTDADSTDEKTYTLDPRNAGD